MKTTSYSLINGYLSTFFKQLILFLLQLNRLINENRSLEAENIVLKEENAIVKERISQLDENAIKRVAAEKDEMIGRLKRQLSVARDELTDIGNDYNALLSKYRNLVLQWNEMRHQPEIIDAIISNIFGSV